jgi:hypothetical protein
MNLHHEEHQGLEDRVEVEPMEDAASPLFGEEGIPVCGTTARLCYGLNDGWTFAPVA